MKYLVTGSAGFIGSNLTDHLIKEGHDVVCIDKNPDGYWNEQAENHIGYDIRDTSFMKKIFKGVDVVFHMAAETQIQTSIKNPAECYDTNVMGTCSVLEAARKNNVRKVILSSTCAIYKCDWLIQPEGSLEHCLNPYSSSKKSAEIMCKMYSDLYELDTLVFRYFNVYGPRQHSKGSYAPVLGIFLRQYKENKPLTIIGDGSHSRDFVHVDDVVNVNILGAITDTKGGEIYNVGSSTSITIKEVADMISPLQSYISDREAEIHSTHAVIGKIKKDLNWQPTIQVRDWLRGEIDKVKDIKCKKIESV